MTFAEMTALIPALVMMSFLILLGYVLGQKRKSTVKQAFTLILVSFLLLALLETLIRLGFFSTLIYPFTVLSTVIVFFGGVLYLHFIYRLINKPIDIIFKIFFAIALLLTPSIFIPGAFEIVFDNQNKFPVVIAAPFLGFLVMLSAGSGILYCLTLCFIHLRKTDNEREFRIVRLVMIGLLLPLIFAVFFLMIAPFLPSQKIVTELAVLSLLFHVIYSFIAVKRYHFISDNIDEIEEVSKSLFSDTTDGVVILGQAGEVVQYNKPAGKLLGEGVSVSIIKKKIPGYKADAAYSNEPVTLSAEEGDRDLLISQSEIRKSNIYFGRLLRMHDITERNAMVKDKLKLEEQLRQSEKMKAVGQLAGGVAHDFNNQLTGILNFAEIIKHKLDKTDESRPLIDNIISCALHSADLTKKLLAFARKGKYVVTGVNMNDIILEVVDILRHSIEKKIVLKHQLTARHALISGDKSQLQNAVLNIALNARDALPDGGDLTFYTEELLLDEECIRERKIDISPGKYVLITISDTGIGMDHHTLTHLYEPFFTTKEPGKGTGMGMASVYGTVQNHYGAIDVHSIPGKGTQISLFLPLAENEAESSDNYNDEKSNGSEHILLVDDEEMVAVSTEALLKSKGYKVITCGSGREAIRFYERPSPKIDLVLLDMVMPDMNGEETFLALKTIDPAVKVLLLSGFSLTKKAEEMLNNGAIGFLQKPVLKNELFQKIDEALEAW